MGPNLENYPYVWEHGPGNLIEMKSDMFKLALVYQRHLLP